MILTPAPSLPAPLASLVTLVAPPPTVGERHYYSDLVQPVRGLYPQLHVNNTPETRLPLTVGVVERHPHAAQVFVPLAVSRYLVTVMPARPDGAPDPSAAASLVLPGTQGVIYHAGTWHVGATVLDGPGHFAVFMWRGAEEDDVFATVPPFQIAAPANLAAAPASIAAGKD